MAPDPPQPSRLDSLWVRPPGDGAMWVTAGVPGSAVADPVPAGGRALAGPAVAERPRADPAPAGVPPSLSGPFAPAPPAPRAPLASVLGRRRNRWLVEWALVLLVAVGVAFGVRTFVVQTFFIPSASMEPTLMIGDRILVDKVSYRLHGVHRGDIVVFGKPPRENAGPDVKDLVKRVIGLPGDHISSQGGRVWIDGKPLAEPWLVPGTITTGITPLTVPANEYFVMGDNRSDSQDSRYFGPISRSLIVGRVVVRIWPLSKLHVF